jgi:hypothetical protein
MSALMTREKLARSICEGYGAGRHDAYRSWIRIRRKLSSPVSNLQALRVPQYTRALQLLSGLEHNAADVLLWLGCREVREQFPLWPVPHNHPLCGTNRELDRKLNPVRGLLAMCRDGGIDHGVYPGTKIPFIATIDFAITVGSWDRERLVLWSCKPRHLLDKAKNRARMHERIEMERLYAREISATHIIIDGELFPAELKAQLDWLRPLKEEVDCHVQQGLLREYSQALMFVAEDRSLAEAKAYAAARINVLGHELAEAYFRASAWYGLIDIDLSAELEFWKPLRRDVCGFKNRLRHQLLGGDHA